MTSISSAAVEDPRAVEALALRWGTAWNERDGDAVAALCAEGLVYDEPALGDTVYGRAAIKDFVVRTTAAFPDYTFSLEGLYADVRRRAILVMYELEGASIPAIAALLGVAAVTVRWHLMVGRREMARVLGDDQ